MGEAVPEDQASSKLCLQEKQVAEHLGVGTVQDHSTLPPPWIFLTQVEECVAEAPENTEGNTKSHKAHHTALRFILTPGMRPTRSLVAVKLLQDSLQV